MENSVNPFSVSPYLAGGVAACFLAVLGFAGCEHVRAAAAVAGEAKAIARQHSAEADRDKAVDANAGNLVTINAQSAALKLWAGLHRTPAEIALIVAAQEAYEKRLVMLGAELLSARKKDEALPDCQAVLRLSLSRACPATTAGLLKLASGRRENVGS
jgi:hypothetical protein